MKKLIFFILFFNFSVLNAKTFNCGKFLTEQNLGYSASNSTESFIAYLKHLLGIGIITGQQLHLLEAAIKNQSQLINPVPNHTVAQGIHHEQIQEYLKQADLDMNAILSWLSATLTQTKDIRISKEEVEEKTKNSFTEMKFHKIRKGGFLQGNKQVQVELTHDFEMMSTPVTQWMWVKEFAVNPSRFKQGSHSLALSVDGKMVELQPDHPVESITWYSAAMFANHMSRKHKLKEVYDFSGVKFKPGTSMEEGNLDVQDGFSGRVKIVAENIYETEGYRLPTVPEYEFALSDRGASQTWYFTGVNIENLQDYAWFDQNAGDATHPVGEKNLTIEGKIFSDLYGNVSIWSNEAQGLFLGGKKDIVQLPAGGSYNKSAVDLRWYRNSGSGMGTWWREPSIGLRLVRTVK